MKSCVKRMLRATWVILLGWPLLLLAETPPEPLSVVKDNGPTSQSLTDEERFRQKYSASGSVNVSQYGGSSNSDICSLEPTYLPVMLAKGSYQTHSFSTDLYENLLTDFAEIIDSNTIAVSSGLDLDESDHFHALSHKSCALGILGLNVIDPMSLAPGDITLITCTVFKSKHQDQIGYFCLCRNPLLGLTEDQCKTLLNKISMTLTGNAFPDDITAAPKYPAYIYKGPDRLGVYSEGNVLVCSDGLLKLAALNMYRQYQRLTEKVARLSNMYDLKVKTLNCDHDLAGATTGGLKKYVACVNNALPERGRRSILDFLLPDGTANITTEPRISNITGGTSPKRLKRDLLSALGIREDISGYVASSNRIIAENFDQISQHEKEMLSILNKETKHLNNYMRQENKNMDAVIRQLSYIRTQTDHVGRLSHHRELTLSSLESLTVTLDEFANELDEILLLALSPLREQNPVCLNGACFDVESLLIDKRENGLVVSVRESQVHSKRLLRMSCRLFEKEGELWKHGLTDRTLMEVKGDLVDRETMLAVSMECISAGVNCDFSHDSVDVDTLLHKNLYISSHHGQLEVQCIKNTTISTVTADLMCNHTPVVVTLPMVLDGKLLDTVHIHYFIAKAKKSRPLSKEEIDVLETEHLPPFTWSTRRIKSEYRKPFNIENPVHFGTLLVSVLVGSIVVTIAGVCCCPTCTQAVFRFLLDGFFRGLNMIGACLGECQVRWNMCCRPPPPPRSLSSHSSLTSIEPRSVLSDPANTTHEYDSPGSSTADAGPSSDEGQVPGHRRSQRLLNEAQKTQTKGPAPKIPRSEPIKVTPFRNAFSVIGAASPALDVTMEELGTDLRDRHIIWDGEEWFPGALPGCNMDCNPDNCAVLKKKREQIRNLKAQELMAKSQSERRIGASPIRPSNKAKSSPSARGELSAKVKSGVTEKNVSVKNVKFGDKTNVSHISESDDELSVGQKSLPLEKETL